MATFLHAFAEDLLPGESGQYLVIPLEKATNAEAVRSILDMVTDADKAQVLADLLAAVAEDSASISALVDSVKQAPNASREVAAALNVARFTSAVQELERFIEQDSDECTFQRHLEQHPWMFGSEYSALLDRRNWVRDSQQDFMLRRTVDGHLEVVEIKTPSKQQPMFIYDESHDSYYAWSD